jgi:antitoxin VapB
MKTAQLVTNGYGQSVLLPEDCRFSGKEVYIKKVAEGILLIRKDRSLWDIWEQNLMKYEEPFMIKREQPADQQERAGLDALFD